MSPLRMHFRRILAARRLIGGHYRESRNVLRTGAYVVKLGQLAAREIIWRGRTLRGFNKLSAAGAINARDRSQHAWPIIGIKISGGLGDCIVVARFIRDLVAHVEPLEFDVFCSKPDVAQWLFLGWPSCRSIFHAALFDELAGRYPVALQVSQFVVADRIHSPALTNRPRLLRVIKAITQFRDQIDVMIDRHPSMDGFLGQKAVYMNFSRADFLHGMANVPYKGSDLALQADASAMQSFQLHGKRYLTIHNGFDADFVMGRKSATKVYPHCGDVVRLLKEKFPQAFVVQVGSSTSTPISGVDCDLIGKTTFAQVAEVLRNSLLHIDGDSGLVHVARCLGARSAVIFGPTSVDYLGYPENINIRPRVCGGCWWITQTWMEQCPRGFERPICMDSQEPTGVVAAIGGYCRFAAGETLVVEDPPA